ncbi:IstB domain protein ATP-binding protein (plasmid) [Pseudonocardia dioxanivorans CB1190]|uniref:IstB domain protein ATP-binding protein n=1 Tax=Pseudonocardia dioxanivorans (strain ATCC 55486 / DSM 44775 / JCM 13855 / CB1190) TaxID=675635 RepID=F2L6H3_PSEUX|nr:IstB domain protein ATP-binding protein [Pseudonocardia dioxanivorans CB1190]
MVDQTAIVTVAATDGALTAAVDLISGQVLWSVPVCPRSWSATEPWSWRSATCRTLRLPTIRSSVDDVVTGAEHEQLTYRGFLAELLPAECDDRDRRRLVRRVKAAGFPREKWLEDFDFAANPNVNPATIHHLAGGEWIRKGDPLCLIGDSGTGKSHLLIGLGTAAAQQGFRIKYALATKLVNELVEAADERQLAKTIARYGRGDLLCIDELGYMQLDRRGAEMLFQVLTEREETNSVAIASNQAFSGWTGTFHRPEALRRDHRPPDLRRADHRDRHRLLPPGPRHGSTRCRRRLSLAALPHWQQIKSP